MGGGPAVTTSGSQNYTDLIDTSVPWWKKRRKSAGHSYFPMMLIIYTFLLRHSHLERMDRTSVSGTVFATLDKQRKRVN
jgi:hypothetical protein